MSKISKKVQQRRREVREKLKAAGCQIEAGNHVRHIESRQTFTWRKGLVNGLPVDAFIAWILLDPPQRVDTYGEYVAAANKLWGAPNA